MFFDDDDKTETFALINSLRPLSFLLTRTHVFFLFPTKPYKSITSADQDARHEHAWRAGVPVGLSKCSGVDVVVDDRRSSLTRSSPRSSVAARAAAPALNDVNDVGLKDAPLKSLFPEENPPPTKVSFIWNRGRGERTLLSSTERRKAS